MRVKLGILAAAILLAAGCGGDDGADVRDISGTTTNSTGSGTGTGTGTEVGTTTGGETETETETETGETTTTG